MKGSRFFIPVLIFLSTLVQAQQVVIDQQDISRRFADEDFYYVYDRTETKITIVEGKLDISSAVSGELYFLNEKANMFSRKSIYYYDETQAITDVVANSYVRQENGKYKKMKVEKTYENKPVKEGVFYDDFKEIYFDYSSLRPSSYSDYNYVISYKDPHLLDPVYLSNNVPTGEVMYSVTFPKEVNLKYVLLGDSSGVVFTNQDQGKLTTFSWKSTNVASSYRIRKEGNYRKVVPHVIIYIDSYILNGSKISVLGNTTDLYNWFYSHVAAYTTEIDPSLKDLADSLTKGLKTDEEKIGAIYYWVQANIRYIAFEYGLGGFVPRSASLVSHRRFGDCKDKSNLLYTLLKSEGFNVYHCWIGTKDLPYKYDQVRSPIAANHMIVGVYRNNKWTFLDGTADNLPLGYPSAFIQGKEAMIGISKDSFCIVTVPFMDKEKNFRTDTLSLTFKGDELYGYAQTKYGGLWRNAISNQYFDVAEKNRTDELRSLFSFGSNKRKIDSLKFSGMDDFSDTLSFLYQLRIPDHVRIIENSAYINLNLNKTFQDDEIEIAKQKTSNNYKFKFVLRSVVKLNLPEGYTTASLPEPKSFDRKSFGYSIKYEKKEKSVIMTKVLYLDTVEVNPEEFMDWNKMVTSIGEEYGNVVVLVKK